MKLNIMQPKRLSLLGAIALVSLTCNRANSQVENKSSGSLIQYDIIDYKLFGKVKSVKETEYEVIESYSGSEKGTKKWLESTAFDYMGRIETSEVYRAYKDETVITSYSYHPTDGKLIEVKEWNSKTTDITKNTFEYNQDRKVNIKSTWINDQLMWYFEYHYDYANHLIEERNVIKYYNQKSPQVRSFKYDDFGRKIVEVLQVGIDGKRIHYFAYDKESNLVEERIHNVGPNASGKEYITSFKYNNVNKVIEEWSGYSDNLALSAAYVYDKYGNMIKETTYGGISSDETRIYDEFGNITEVLTLNDDGTISSKTIYAYDYSNNGNWLRMKVISDGVLTKISEREITYY